MGSVALFLPIDEMATSVVKNMELLFESILEFPALMIMIKIE